MFRSLLRLLLLPLLLIWSCTSSAPTPAPGGATPAPAGPAAPVRYLALGDSYTIGQGVSAAERWCVQLAQLGQVSNIQTPDIIAQTGWTTADLQRAIASSGNTSTYDLVSLLIGVNNQYQGVPLETYRLELRALLQTAIRYAGNRRRRVVVLSIPDWGQSPAGRGYGAARIGQEIDRFNAVAREESNLAGVAFVDITDLTRGAANDPTQFTADGLHYSGPHMRKWAQRVLPVVQGLL